MKILTTTIEQGGITYEKPQISCKSQFLQQKTSCKKIMKSLALNDCQVWVEVGSSEADMKTDS